MEFVPRDMGEAADNSRGGKEGWRSRLKGILSAVIILAVLYLVLGWVADLCVGLVPEEAEVEMFGWLHTILEEDSVDPDPELQALFEKLIDAGDLRAYPYRLRVTFDLDANAFAVPGGLIMVTTGFLDMVQGERGRAMVLGHELGHLQHRHGLERLGRRLLLAGAGSFLGFDTSWLLDQSQFLAEMNHSRSQESECDDFGLRLVQSTFGTTEGAMEFFEDMARQTPDATDPFDRMKGWMQTHPLTEDRLEDLERLATELEGRG